MTREPFDPDDRGPGRDRRRNTGDERAEQRAREVIGAAIDVHKTLGPGFPESVYEEALSVELRHQRIPFTRQTSFRVTYRNEEVGQGRTDLLIDSLLIVELKTVEELASIHAAQVVAYLRALDLRLGLLINFNVRVLKDGLKRIVL